jgi:hypothetical protein
MQAKRSEQDLAKDLYLSTNLTHQQIADLLDVNRRTVWVWIRNNRWEELKAATRQTPGLILNDIYSHITAINDKIREREPGDRCPAKDEVESLRKLINMTNSIQKKSPGLYLEAFGELMMFVNKMDRELALKMSPYVEKYIAGNFGNTEFKVDKECSANVRQVMSNLDKLRVKDIANLPNNIQDKEDDQCDTSRHSACRDDFGKSCQTATDEESPFRGLGCEHNGSICEHDGSICEYDGSTPAAPQKAPKPATDDMDQEIADMLGIHIDEVRKNSEHVTTIPQKKEEKEGGGIHRIMKLPPEQRPSPFRDGDTIWVNFYEDTEKPLNNLGQPWGKRIAGDLLRRYSSYGQY